jgi:hypothetical protein
MPAGLVQEQHGMLAGAGHVADLGQVQVHRRGVAQGQDQGRALAVLRADGAEDVGRRVALVLRCRRAGTTPRPAPGDVVLLANPGFVGEPDLYRVETEALVPRDARQRGGEVF